MSSLILQTGPSATSFGACPGALNSCQLLMERVATITSFDIRWFPNVGRPKYRSQYTIFLMMGTPKMAPPSLVNPKSGWARVGPRCFCTLMINWRACSLAVLCMWGFPKSSGTFLKVPIIGPFHILGCQLGSPYLLWNLPCGGMVFCAW